MEVTIKISDKIAAEARAFGLPVEIYVQEILAHRALNAPAANHLESIGDAVDHILELRKGNRLAGLHPSDPIRECRKR